jgi:hypothetical protein
MPALLRAREKQSSGFGMNEQISGAASGVANLLPKKKSHTR